jgi:hypothetical protein
LEKLVLTEKPIAFLKLARKDISNSDTGDAQMRQVVNGPEKFLEDKFVEFH